MPPPDPPLSSHADQFSPSEPFSADKFPLCNSSVANTGHLPLLESYLDHDNFSKFDSSLQSHLPLSDSVVVGDGDQFIESSTDHQIPQPKSFHDFDLLNLPECLFAPNFKDLNLPDFDPFHLDMHPGDPGTEMSLFDELLACNANQTLLPESIATPTSDELSLVDSCLQNYGDHVLPSHMSVPPNEDQLPFTDPNPALKKDEVQLCQSLRSSKVEQPLSESFLESSADQQLPQSDLASEVDQPNSAHQSTLESTSEFSQISPANTGFSNSIVEEFQIPWDWTSDLHHAEFTGVVLDGNSDIYLNLTPDDGDSQVHEIDDCFSLFCLDTPPKSPIASPEIDPLTLSDDLLSLCDVFSQLQSNDPISPESNIELCCALDSLSLHQTEEFTTDQLPIIKEEIFSPVNDPQSDNIPASNEHACLNAHDRTFNGISDHSLNQTDSYCLDLLFEPKLVSCETQCSPTSPAANPCPQLLFDPTFRDVTSATVPGHCDVTTPTHSHVYTTQSALPQESLCCSNEHLPPAGQSDSPLHRVKSSSHVDIEMGSTAELLGKTLQLPLILGKEPLDLLDDLPENNQDVLLSKSEEALPPDKFEPEMDNPIEDEEVPPCNVNEHALFRSEQPDLRQISAGLSDSIAQSVPNDTTQSKLDTDFENLTSTPCGPVEQIEKVALSRTVSPLENTQVLPCDSHQDSASATFSFGEGDPFLGFALDNDSPCVGDELARLRAVFNALDRDKDGFVKMEDFVQFATVYGAEQVKYLTGYLDPAGLGVINFRDFYRGISEIQNEDLDMQLYDMGYPSEGEPACSVDFDDLAAFEVTEVTDSAYVGSESAYSECETFTDEDTGGLTAQEDPETEGDGAGSRRHTSASPEGLELSLCDISVVTVAGQEEQFEDFGEGAEPDLFNSHCEDETDSFTQTSNSTKRLTSSPDKRTYSRKEARRLHHNGFLGEEPEEQQQTEMAYDDTDLTDKVLYLEQRVSELERDAATTNEQQNRLRQENLQLLHRVHALEEQLKDQELLSDEVQSEETRKHRDELRKMERDRSYRLSSLKARLQELENENTELRSQLPGAKATTQRLEEEKLKLLDQIEDLQHQLQEHQEQNRKLGGKLSKEMHKQQTEKERCQEVIEELRRELEQMQLMRLEMEQRMGLGNSAALQEYNSRTREAELEQEVRRLKQEQRILKEQNEELNGQIINLSIQGAKNLFSTTFSDSLAAEISSVSRDELMEAIQKQEEINLRLQDYIDRIIVAIMETNPAILEVKIH
ncbi:rab11 family-interacting protein 3 isoform X2 [Pyxicephalus adspersus]